MRTVSERLPAVLTSSVTYRFVADVFYGATRVISDLPIIDPTFKSDLEAGTKGTGAATVAYTPEFAESLTPYDFADALAPFGAEVGVRCEVSAGKFAEMVQIGRYRIADIPTGRDEFTRFRGQVTASGSVVGMVFTDRSKKVERAGFTSPQNPRSYVSAWDEIGRISQATLLRSVPDKAIPGGIVYEASKGGRWKAVEDLASVLGGVPIFDPFGNLTVVPDAWGSAVARLRLGDEGTILDVEHSLTSENVYNEVVGNFEDANQNPIFAYAAITDGPLAVRGEFGANTYYAASPLVKTQAAANSFVATRLASLSSQYTYRVPVNCLYDPRLEVGDVVEVERPDRMITGRIISLGFGSDGRMKLELEVRRVIA